MQFGCNSVYTHFDGLNNFNLRECFHAIISLDKCINPNWDEWKKRRRKKEHLSMHATRVMRLVIYFWVTIFPLVKIL